MLKTLTGSAQNTHNGQAEKKSLQQNDTRHNTAPGKFFHVFLLLFLQFSQTPPESCRIP